MLNEQLAIIHFGIGCSKSGSRLVKLIYLCIAVETGGGVDKIGSVDLGNHSYTNVQNCIIK